MLEEVHVRVDAGWNAEGGSEKRRQGAGCGEHGGVRKGIRELLLKKGFSGLVNTSESGPPAIHTRPASSSMLCLLLLYSVPLLRF